MRTGVRALFLSIIVALPDVLAGQAATAAQLVGKMQDVSVYPIFPLARSGDNFARTGQGIEFSFLIGERKRPMSDAERRVRCARAEEPAKCDPRIKEDTTRTLSELRRSYDAQNIRARDSILALADSAARTRGLRHLDSLAHYDSIFTITLDKSAYQVTSVQFELAVATQTTELRHVDARDAWDLEGKIQEFPALSLYSTFRPDWFVSPYVGIRYTLADLKNIRIVQGDSISTVEGTTSGGGATVGGVVELFGFNLFAETSYNMLRFDTSRWKVPANIQPQPASYPKRLALTGLRFAVGAQLSLGGK